ncbi:unnamed protein product [Rotaria sordida]|uniref:PhoD-like phosphatase domain-containing protein n=1 Tax=Rotaria sordida TaxID=392033 RepID=A0A814D5G2_9BILA|nr:unnamed protein product [Rotaria sordida]CAF3655037.1 unnamed protein product [Rotaria sordida]
MTQRIGKERLNECDNDNIGSDENDNLRQPVTEDLGERPPRPPPPAMGPYYQFITTDLEKMLWVGSVLILRHVSYDQPTIEFTAKVKVAYDWEILYENLFDMRVYRINLNIELPNGNDDEKICWTINWGDYSTNGFFHIAQYDQKWRGGFFSCNGFDATVTKEVALGLTYNSVWNHLLSCHEENPFHLLIWGGDQNYHDFIFDDIPFLQDWTNIEWNKRWTYQFPDESKHEVEQYYFNNYSENWARRPEMRKALESIPSVMMWDDHDIYDGAGSYPPLLLNSPIMMGLLEIAQKMRLLFQHHTTPEKARKHQLFGYKGHNYLARCGPNLALLGADGRTERNDKTVQHEKTWDLIFEKLDNDLNNVKHVIIVFAVPFSFARFTLAESFLETWKKITMAWESMPLRNQTNSVFGLPELYDDLLDEWTHGSHIDERDRALSRFQEIAHKNKIRITFFSGDVHCCGVSRFQTRGKTDLSDINDSKLMYQIISSAIVNRPPPSIVIRAAHLFATTWYPNTNTEEALLDFFEEAPHGSRLFLRKLLPNRNWCYFEQCTTMDSTPPNRVMQTGFLGRYFWPFIQFLLLLIGLTSIVDWIDQKLIPTVIHKNQQESSSSSSHIDSELEQEANNLKIQFWLENSVKKKTGPRFASYELFVPSLK